MARLSRSASCCSCGGAVIFCVCVCLPLALVFSDFPTSRSDSIDMRHSVEFLFIDERRHLVPVPPHQPRKGPLQERATEIRSLTLPLAEIGFRVLDDVMRDVTARARPGPRDAAVPLLAVHVDFGCEPRHEHAILNDHEEPGMWRNLDVLHQLAPNVILRADIPPVLV